MMMMLKGKSISFTHPQLFTAIKTSHYGTLEKVKEGVRREGCDTVSSVQLLIMLRNIGMHIPSSNLLLRCLQDSENNNKFAELSIATLGVGFSL